MSNDTLYEQKVLVGAKVKDCIWDKGYTKVSFAVKAGMSRSALDELLDGKMSDEEMFSECLCVALDTLDVSSDELLTYCPVKLRKRVTDAEWFFAEHTVNNVAREQYGLLQDLLELCAIYY